MSRNEQKIEQYKNIVIKQGVVIFILSLFYGCHTPLYVSDWEKWGLNSSIRSITEYSYKAKMHEGLVEKDGRSREAFESDYKLIFDQNGNCIEKILYSFKDSVDCKCSYKNDKYGNLIEQKFDKNCNWSLGEIVVFHNKYDKNGNLVKQTSKNEKKEVIRKVKYKYNKQGYCIEDVLDGVSKITYVRDEDGKCIEDISYTPDGEVEIRYTYKYDEKGNVIEQTCYYLGNIDEKKTYSYIYDEKGNWVTKTKFEKGKPKYIIERSYSYYE